mmetsp:Transcript_17403/g.29285  ORF Transcript_17403/g.29285 Transcript_17403/m.29285 type:complete len:333 (+) Transcript_17403:13-1011(+)
MSVNLSQEAIQTLDSIKLQLKQQKEVEGSNVKTDLYSHLTEVFNRILTYHPYDAFDKFEEISNLVKQTNLKFVDPKFDFEINVQGQKLSKDQQLEFISRAKNLLREVPDVGIKPQDKVLFTKDKQFCIPNLSEQAQLLQWGGIDFGSDNIYLLQKSLKRLAVLSGASQLKFFGKMLGTVSDYWVAQGTLDFQEEDEETPGTESRGKGVNSTVFWVTDSLLSDWIQLPDATPETIQIARMIKKVLTGNLNATIDSNPPFPGKERHFLRAQLARIQHATEICPKGIYEIDEETQEIKMAEEPPALGFEEFKSLENWAHQHPIILKAGRCSHIAP